jgi:hypothetical protein
MRVVVLMLFCYVAAAGIAHGNLQKATNKKRFCRRGAEDAEVMKMFLPAYTLRPLRLCGGNS